MRLRFGLSLLLILVIGIIGCSSGTTPEPLPEDDQGSNAPREDLPAGPTEGEENRYADFTEEECRVVELTSYSTDPIALITEHFIACNANEDIEGAFSHFTPKVREKFGAQNLVGVVGGNAMEIQTIRYLPDNVSAQATLLAVRENPVTEEPINLQLLLGFRKIETEGWKIAAVGYQLFEGQELIQLDLENFESVAAAASAGEEEAYRHYEALDIRHNQESPENTPEGAEDTPEEGVEETSVPVAPLPTPMETTTDPPAPRTSAYPPLNAMGEPSDL
jgi:hypothetical protein